MSEIRETMSDKNGFFRWCLQNPLELLVCLLLIALTFVVFLQVLLRYAFHAPLGWSEEFTMFIFQWFNLLAAAVAVRYSYHFAVDVIVRNLPSRWQAAAQLMSSLLTFAVAYIMIHMGIQMVIMSMGYNYHVLQFPLAYAYVVFPISGTLMIFFQIPLFIRQLRHLKGE